MEAARIPQPQAEAGALLAELFDAHGRVILGICRAILRDPDEAEDAAQQAFLSAHAALVRGTRPRSPAAWLTTIARNECRARIARRRSVPQALPLVDECVEAPDAGPEAQAQRSAEIDALTGALAELPKRQREAVLLRDLFGLSYREVAVALSASEPAVESLLSRARRRLEDRVGPIRAVPGILVVPQSLRDELARLVPGFTAGEAAAAAGGGAAAGVLAKLASAPLLAKVGATAAVATIALGGDTPVADRARDVAPRGSIPKEQVVQRPVRSGPSVPSVGTQQIEVRSSSGPGSGGSADADRDNSGPGSVSSGSGSDSENSGPGSTSSGSGSGSTSENSGPGSTSSGSGSGSTSENSGPGSTSSGSGSGETSENSGPGSTSSGSGSDNSGSGSGGDDDD